MAKRAPNILILGDLHGRKAKVEAVLKQAGVLADDGTRNEGFHVIQLGDAVSLGYHEEEYDFFIWLHKFVDEWILGNHEAPAFWPNHDLDFSGFEYRDEECAIVVRKKFENGDYKAATSVGEWIISHAGIESKYSIPYGYHNLYPTEIVADIHDRFTKASKAEGWPDALISGGQGLLWIRIGALEFDYLLGRNPLKQIVGHTPSGGPKLYHDKLYCIDSPPVHHHIHGGVVGLLTSDNGKTFKEIYVP